jgi:hypothetical protein
MLESSLLCLLRLWSSCLPFHGLTGESRPGFQLVVSIILIRQLINQYESQYGNCRSLAHMRRGLAFVSIVLLGRAVSPRFLGGDKRGWYSTPYIDRRRLTAMTTDKDLFFRRGTVEEFPS